MAVSSDVLTSIMLELTQGAAEIAKEELETMVRSIRKAKRVYVAGAGRSGFIARGFAMRLMHLGMQAYVVGEPTTPAIRAHDLLVILSGSGNTSGLVAMAEKAKALQADIALLTTNRKSKLAELCDTKLLLPGVSKEEAGIQGRSIQMSGSMYEQLAWICCHAMVVMMMKESGLSSSDLMTRHANLE